MSADDCFNDKNNNKNNNIFVVIIILVGKMHIGRKIS